jgi:electron transfer flavoprotein beta subunit
MKILVCIKQVPELETAIPIDDNGRWIQLKGFTDFKINRLDDFAVEEAVRLKEDSSNTTIDIISVGPGRSADVIRRAMGMGADHGVHILTGAEGYLSSSGIAGWIADYARSKTYSLIFTGAISEDNMQGQVGPMIAAYLDLPCATGVVFKHLDRNNETIYVEREIEGGNRHCLELTLPAVLTIQSSIHKPRYPSLSNLLRANKAQLETIDSAGLERPEPRESIARVSYPHKLRAGKILEGSQQKKAARLLRILREKAFIQCRIPDKR